jgi:hypothetical protein
MNSTSQNQPARMLQNPALAVPPNTTRPGLPRSKRGAKWALQGGVRQGYLPGLSFTAEGSRFLLRFTPKPQPDTSTAPVLVHEHDARIHIFVSWHEVAVTAGLRLSRSQTPTQSASAPRRLNRCGAFFGPQPVLDSFLCWGYSKAMPRD